jgi:hypothetical protein
MNQLVFAAALLLLAVSGVLASRDGSRGPRRAAFVGTLLFAPLTILAIREGLSEHAAVLVATVTLAFVVFLGGRGGASAA